MQGLNKLKADQLVLHKLMEGLISEEIFSKSLTSLNKTQTQFMVQFSKCMEEDTA